MLSRFSVHLKSFPVATIRCASSATNNGVTVNWVAPSDAHKSFYSKDVLVTPAPVLKQKPLEGEPLGFGSIYADHMTDIDWDSTNGWLRPHIHKLEPFQIHPGSKSLHYASQLFEGMKAYRGVDGKIRLFRPELNMARMKRSAIRCALPDFDGEQLIQIICEQIRLDAEWVPYSETGSLYIRPTLIGTDPTLGVSMSHNAKLFVLTCPVGGYFGGGTQAVSLLADPNVTRAWSGGVGAFKMGCNYAPTVQIGKQAEKRKCQQVLWLAEKEEWVTEAGTMNLFVFWKNDQGEMELITPSLDSGMILPGITRQSLLDLARDAGTFKVAERDFTMEQLRQAVHEGRVFEMFGAGTAVVVTPVESVVYVNRDGSEDRLEIPTLNSEHGVMRRLYDSVVDIQYGRAEKEGWTRLVV